MLLYEASNTEFRVKGYRFYFLSNEESRIHIHIECAEGEAKFWIEPIIALATCYRLNPRQLSEIQKIVEKHKNEIIKEWQNYFGKR
ncbi:MAG: DUF4160 domain-containing protein [Candidatus Omnitrophica bacterium]|nr:DUF4160 domain-containing protein [Candidatus Omnitrophota bacterium]